MEFPSPATQVGLGQTYRLVFETELIGILTASLTSSLNLLRSLLRRRTVPVAF